MCANRVSSKPSITATGSATSAHTAAEDLAKKNLNEFTETAIGISTSSSPPPVVNNQTNLGHAATGDTASKTSASNETLDEIWDRLFADVFDQPIDYSYQPPDPDSFKEKGISPSVQNSSPSGINPHADIDPAVPLKSPQATAEYLNPFEDPNYQPTPITNLGNPFVEPARPYAAPTADGQAVPQIFGKSDNQPGLSSSTASVGKPLDASSGKSLNGLPNSPFPFDYAWPDLPENRVGESNSSSSRHLQPEENGANTDPAPINNNPWTNGDHEKMFGSSPTPVVNNNPWTNGDYEKMFGPGPAPVVNNNPWTNGDYERMFGPGPAPVVNNNPWTNGDYEKMFGPGPAPGVDHHHPDRPAFVNVDGSPANTHVSATNPFASGSQHRNQGLFCMAMHEYALGLCQQLGLPPQYLSGLLDFYLDNAIDAYKKALDVNPDMPLDPQTEKTAALARRANAEKYVQHQIKLFGKDAFKPTFDPLTKKNGEKHTSSLTQDDMKEYSGLFSTSEQETLTSSIETITAYQSSQQKIPTSMNSDDDSDDAGEGSDSGETGSDETPMISATSSDQSQGHSIARTLPKSQTKTLAQSTAQPLPKPQPTSTRQQPASNPVSPHKNAAVTDGTAKWGKKYPDRSNQAVQARAVQLQQAMQAEMQRPLTGEETRLFIARQQITPDITELQFRKDYIAKKVRDGALLIVLKQINEIANDRNNITTGNIQLPDAVKQKRLADLNEIDDYLHKVSQAFWTVSA